MKVKIEIDTKTFVRFWLVVIGFAAVILALYTARTALILVGVALFLALALNGPVAKLAGKLPNRNRVLSTAIAFLLIIVLVGAIIFLVLPPIFEQTRKAIENAPAILDSMSNQWRGIGALIDKYNIQPQVDSIVDSAKQSTDAFVAGLGHGLIEGVSSAVSILVSTIIVLVMTFFMLVEGPMWSDRIWKLYSDRKRMAHHRELVYKMIATISGYVTAQLTVAAIGAVVAGLSVYIMSLFLREIPSTLALATVGVTFVVTLIPMFGAAIAGIIISLLLAVNHVIAAVIFFIFFLAYQQFENSVLAPLIQGRRIDLSPLVVLVAVTIGVYIGGVAGAIVSIPVAGSCKVLLEDYIERKKNQQKIDDKPINRLIKKLKPDA